jgi:(p)ppGpp synthase/HD superfamily hydrolase
MLPVHGTHEALALAIATRAHAGQRDKAGEPYIEHPKRVAARLERDEERSTALLHDVLEDTPMTAADLLAAGIPAQVVRAVETLTKQKGETYEAYMQRVKRDPLARSVRLADLGDNMDLSRLPVVTERDLKRLSKYEWARAYLLEPEREARE